MKDLVTHWIQSRLGVVFNWTADVFCENTRDGYLLCQILRSYELINDDQLEMIQKSALRPSCLDNFEKHITNWLKNIDIHLKGEEVNEIVDSKGFASLCLFYKVFLELHEKDNLTFITEQRVKEKLRPPYNRFTVNELKESPYEKIPTLKNKYTVPLENGYDVIHWHQDRLEALVSKCKASRDDYMSVIRAKERRFSSSYSMQMSVPEPFKKEATSKTSLLLESAKSVDLTYHELVEEKNKSANLEKFEPNPLESSKILKKYKAKKRKQEENSIIKKQLHKTILNSFWERLESEDSIDSARDITEKLLKQSLYEKQMMRKLDEVKRQREAIIQNKQVITEAILKEKEAQFVDKFLNANKDLDEKEFQYYLEKEKADELHKRIYQEKLRLKSERHNNICRDVVNDICNLALKECDYKETFGEEPSSSVRNTWKKMFIVGEKFEQSVTPLEVIVKPDDLPEEMEEIVHCEIERQNNIDRAEFESYKNFEWPWQAETLDVAGISVQDMSRGENILGYVVHALLATKYPSPAPPAPPDLPKQVKVAACINGLTDDSCLPSLQQLLRHQGIAVVVMQDAINFCLTAFRDEMKRGDEEDDTPAPEEVVRKRGKSQSGSKPRKGAKSKGKQSLGVETDQRPPTPMVMADKVVQTPKVYPCEEISLTRRAELGRVAEEELSNGRLLTDYLCVHMFVEYLKSIPDLRGWVLINYPSTLEQAVLLEETLTGIKVPNTLKPLYHLGDLMTDLDLGLEEPLEENTTMKESKLLGNPLAKKEYPFFDSALTAYIKLNQSGDTAATSASATSTNLDEASEDLSPLEIFYSDMGCNYSMYYENLDFPTVKYLAKLIIGDYSIPPKSSIELFGDTVKYMSADRMDSDGRGIRSDKKGMKKEPERRERVFKMKNEATEVDKSVPVMKKGRKGKSSSILGHAIIVHEDKFTQIPEIVYEVVDTQEALVEPGDAGWAYVSYKLPEELQISLATLWENVEEVYIGDFDQVFFMKRIILNAIMPAVDFFKQVMKLYVEHPDDKQSYLRKFQQIYNEFDDDVRADEEFKAELHCRVNEMHDKLIDICDRKMMDTDKERCNFLSKGWFSKQIVELLNNYVNAFQLEIDRHVDTFIFLNDYYAGIISKMPNEESLPKEILSKFELDDSIIDSAITDLLVNVEKENDKPLEVTVEQVFSRIWNQAVKCQNWAWSMFEKGKSRLLPLEKRKASKKEKKSEKGSKSSYAPEDELKKISGKLLEEWACALKGESARLTIRLHLLKRDLKQNLDAALHTMKKTSYAIFQDIRSRYRNDVESITEACIFLGKAIETERPIREELILRDQQFFVNANRIYYPDSPPPERQLLELCHDLMFTVAQLERMTDVLFDLAPSGYIPERSFVYLLQDMIADEEKVLMPKSWLKLSPENVVELSRQVLGPHQSLRWKQFIVCNLMVRFPDVEELLSLRRAFVDLDKDANELITEEQFEEICFWFETEIGEARAPLVRNLMYKLYRVNEDSFNYTAMLLDFCKGVTVQEGLAKALALCSGKALCWDEEVGRRFVADVLEKRRMHEEEVRIRNEERRQAEEIMNSIMDEVIDETVHQCESIIIEDLPPAKNVDSKQNSRMNSIRSKDNLHVKILSERMESDDKLSNSESKKSSFDNVEIGFECSTNSNVQYFLQLDGILSVLTVVLSHSHNVQNIEDKSVCEILGDIYEECKNPEFSNEVLSHEFLNNAKLLNLLDDTVFFLVKNPLEIVQELVGDC